MQATLTKQWQWLRRNLFANPFDATVTLSLLCLLYLFIPDLLEWMVFDATWIGETRADCTGDGACWIFIKEKFVQFLVGFYPESEFYRLGWVAGIFAVLFGPLLHKKVPYRLFLLCLALLFFPILSWLILEGTELGLKTVPTSQWGGLMLTLIIASVGIVAALPLGTILALGRRSQLPIIKTICILFIELWRAVPLITVLFMASVMLPLFLPEGVTFDKLIRALVGVTLFSAAYMAEVIRGGLQAIPRGQYEAADAMGLKYWQVMGKIIMPQALKKVIPGIVNTFIGLFKDTTLVLIIGMFDLLGIVQAAATDPDWLGYAVEGYVFAGAVFWVFCFAMSRFSQRLEVKLNTEH